MQDKQVQAMFAVHCNDAATPERTGTRLAVGRDALAATVNEFTPALTRTSREAMRALLEEDLTHIKAMFAGRQYLSVHAATGSRRIDIYLISGDRGL